MPIRVSALTADRATVSLPVGDDVLHVTYRPSAVNAQVEETMAGASARPIGAMADLLAALIVSWDVVDEAGTPVEPSRAFLGTLGVAVLRRLVEAIGADLVPNRWTAVTSDDGSVTAGPQG